MIFDFYRQVSLCSLSMSTMYKIITQVATLLSGCLFIGQVTTYWEQDSTADYWEQGKLPLAGNRASFHLPLLLLPRSAWHGGLAAHTRLGFVQPQPPRCLRIVCFTPSA